MNEEINGIPIYEKFAPVHKTPGPYIERKGRVYSVTLEVAAPEEATPAQISEAIEYEMGCGDMADGNPAEGRMDVSVVSIDNSRKRAFTLWNALGEGCDKGVSRTGKRIHLPDGQRLEDHVAYEPPKPKPRTNPAKSV